MLRSSSIAEPSISASPPPSSFVTTKVTHTRSTMATSLLFPRAPLFLSNPKPNHRPYRYNPLSLHLKNKPLKASLQTPQISTHSPLLTDSTRTVTTILSLTFSLSGLFAKSIQNFALSNPQPTEPPLLTIFTK